MKNLLTTLRSAFHNLFGRKPADALPQPPTSPVPVPVLSASDLEAIRLWVMRSEFLPETSLSKLTPRVGSILHGHGLWEGRTLTGIRLNEELFVSAVDGCMNFTTVLVLRNREPVVTITAYSEYLVARTPFNRLVLTGDSQVNQIPEEVSHVLHALLKFIQSQASPNC